MFSLSLLSPCDLFSPLSFSSLCLCCLCLYLIETLHNLRERRSHRRIRVPTALNQTAKFRVRVVGNRWAFVVIAHSGAEFLKGFEFLEWFRFGLTEERGEVVFRSFFCLCLCLLSLVSCLCVLLFSVSACFRRISPFCLFCTRISQSTMPNE